MAPEMKPRFQFIPWMHKTHAPVGLPHQSMQLTYVRPRPRPRPILFAFYAFLSSLVHLIFICDFGQWGTGSGHVQCNLTKIQAYQALAQAYQYLWAWLRHSTLYCSTLKVSANAVCSAAPADGHHCCTHYTRTIACTMYVLGYAPSTPTQAYHTKHVHDVAQSRGL